jgi:hypothetical protein
MLNARWRSGRCEIEAGRVTMMANVDAPILELRRAPEAGKVTPQLLAGRF